RADLRPASKTYNQRLPVTSWLLSLSLFPCFLSGFLKHVAEFFGGRSCALHGLCDSRACFIHCLEYCNYLFRRLDNDRRAILSGRGRLLLNSHFQLRREVNSYGHIHPHLLHLACTWDGIGPTNPYYFPPTWRKGKPEFPFFPKFMQHLPVSRNYYVGRQKRAQ